MTETKIERNHAEPFTAACGHDVAAENDYVVEQGTSYCSPACATKANSLEITVRLADDASLARLLAGPLTLRTWLTDNGDDTYTLWACQVEGTPAEAYALLGYSMCVLGVVASGGKPWQAPPLPTPSEEVMTTLDKLSVRLGLYSVLKGEGGNPE